jgi:hypothetical protein
MPQKQTRLDCREKKNPEENDSNFTTIDYVKEKILLIIYGRDEIN